jgi:hypothetical protein
MSVALKGLHVHRRGFAGVEDFDEDSSSIVKTQCTLDPKRKMKLWLTDKEDCSIHLGVDDDKED